MDVLNTTVVSLLPLVPRRIVRIFALRYIAGENLADAVRVVYELNQNGMAATIDVLGEDVTEKARAVAAREAAKEVLHAIAAEQLDSNLSIKLTQFGLKLDKSFCLDNVHEVLAVASQYSNFVRIDMEDHTCTDDTLEIFEVLRKEFSNVGVVIQAYLRRSESDVQRLVTLSRALGRLNVRLCKGIYVEPQEIAFKKHDEINTNFKRLLRLLIDGGCYVGIATHDSELIDDAYGVINDRGLKRDAYEFQMLLGVRPELRKKIVADGHRLRVYVPFGQEWYRYSMRRFKENPQIAGYVFKSLFHRNTFLGVNPPSADGINFSVNELPFSHHSFY